MHVSAHLHTKVKKIKTERLHDLKINLQVLDLAVDFDWDILKHKNALI